VTPGAMSRYVVAKGGGLHRRCGVPMAHRNDGGRQGGGAVLDGSMERRHMAVGASMAQRPCADRCHLDDRSGQEVLGCDTNGPAGGADETGPDDQGEP